MNRKSISGHTAKIQQPSKLLSKSAIQKINMRSHVVGISQYLMNIFLLVQKIRPALAKQQQKTCLAALAAYYWERQTL